MNDHHADRYAICSNQHCDHAIPFDSFLIELTTVDAKVEMEGNNVETLTHVPVKRPVQLELAKDSLPEERFCKKCGSQLHFYCPHCKIGFFCIPNPIYCSYCGSKIK